MTKNKDLKRLVRTRMTKTGESYTTARAQITGAAKLAKKQTEPKADWPAIAGQKDEVIQRNTGRTWAEWVSVLDAFGAPEKTHTEIATYVRDELGVSGWWAQNVTVGYERIRGLRAKNQRRGGAFEAGKSKTLAVPVKTAYAAFTQKRRQGEWLDVTPKIRTRVADKSLRITWPDDTNVEVLFTPKGASKTTVTVTHKKLASQADVALRKTYWGERLEKLADVLNENRSS